MHPIALVPVPVLDTLARAAARSLRKVTPVIDAGAFWVSGSAPFVDAWAEPGAFILRLGRLELVADLKR